MTALTITIVALAAIVFVGFLLGIKVVKQHEQGVVLRLGRVLDPRDPGLHVIIPIVDIMHQISRRTRPLPTSGASGHTARAEA